MNTARFGVISVRNRLVGAAVALAAAAAVCAGVTPTNAVRSDAVNCPLSVAPRDTLTSTGALALKRSCPSYR